MTRAAAMAGGAVEVLGQDPSPLRTAMQPSGTSPQDLGELIAAFNDVTTKLQRSHEKLHGEVARLTRELEDANAQIERSQRLAALGEMAAGIAHEVRNPLGSIRLYARMLEQDLVPESEPQGVARKISRSATAIEQIVGDVLSFAREHRLQRHEIEPCDVVERAMEVCVPQAHPTWRNVRIDRVGSVAGVIEADPGLLQQALVNVVRNALEAMEESPAPSGGHVLRLSLEERDEVGGRAVAGVAFVVRDTGPGVTPEVVGRMFNPFFTTRSAGTGLGLSIVHRIVDAHGGGVRVRNNRDFDGRDVDARDGDGRDACGACIELVVPRTSGDSGAAGGRALV